MNLDLLKREKSEKSGPYSRFEVFKVRTVIPRFPYNHISLLSSRKFENLKNRVTFTFFMNEFSRITKISSLISCST